MDASTRTRSRIPVGLRTLPIIALALLVLPTPSRQHQGQILHVNPTDPTCQGQAPCYATIQAAVTAAQAGDTIRIQAGTATSVDSPGLSGALESRKRIVPRSP